MMFSINKQLGSIWPIIRTLSGVTTTDKTTPGSDDNEEVLCIPQTSSITGTSPSDNLVPYLGHSFGKSYASAEKHEVYSTATADWAIIGFT